MVKNDDEMVWWFKGYNVVIWFGKYWSCRDMNRRICFKF